MIVLQINLKDITKRPLRLTALPEIRDAAIFDRLKLIGEELWLCHNKGITVYDCQWNTLREIRLGRRTRSVAALCDARLKITLLRGQSGWGAET